MRKFNKLFLTILPISSISAFSVVSCTTSTKNNNQIPTIPNNKKPDNQKQPNENKPGSTEEHTNKEPNENTNDQKQPNSSEKSEAEPSPGKPENKPDDSHNPKQPENNNSNNDQPQGDQPRDEPNDKINFKDIETLKKDYSFKYITQYNSINATSAWIKIKGEQTRIFKDFIFKDSNSILNNYQVELDPENQPDINDQKGTIDKVRIKFTKDKESKIIYFTFTGFKPQENVHKEDKTKNKRDYIKPKDNIDSSFLGLYPSLVAYMLLYIEEGTSNNKYDKDIKQTGNVINFDDLKNYNRDLFEDTFKGFGPGTKELLFNYKEDYRRIYKDKITKARYNDFTGELELEVQITNTDDHTSSNNDPIITMPFTFKGFRKIDVKKPQDNVLNLSLTKKGLNEIINKQYLKNVIKQLKDHNALSSEKEINIGDVRGKGLEDDIFDQLIVDIDDKTHKIYKSTQTLGLTYGKKSENKSLLGLKNNMTLYPFHARVNKNSVKNINVIISKKGAKNELKIEFEVHFNVYASTLSDLTSETYAKEDTLKLKISQTTQIN
ncbi:LppA family lipoprotein [Mycoplasma mycoides]|uniref:LppA family lipoprotein n=1 Tax=Mycoplasma mycoides TaxID=2102 RepID=UPI0022400A49|nr:LppA family lipoprotein [Mycoplasma mycoides]QVK09172.1 LppA family lipoprotein [Mycoplasma mycoides subsp. capri]